MVLKLFSFIVKAFLCFREKCKLSYDKIYLAWKDGHNPVLSEKSKVLNIIPFISKKLSEDIYMDRNICMKNGLEGSIIFA